MMKKNSVHLSLLLLILVAAVPARVWAVPDSANLNFRYFFGSRLLNITHELDEAPSRACRFTLRGLVSYEGVGEIASVRSLMSFRTRRAKRVRLRLGNVPPVELDENGNRPVLTLQAKVVCSGTRIFSNARARYVNCDDVNATQVSPKKFLDIVRRGLR